MEKDLLNALGHVLQAKQNLTDAVAKSDDRTLKDTLTIICVDLEISADKLRNVITENGFFTV